MGIEPTSEAWEASILPLNYTRENSFQLFYNTKSDFVMEVSQKWPALEPVEARTKTWAW